MYFTREILTIILEFYSALFLPSRNIFLQYHPFSTRICSFEHGSPALKNIFMHFLLFYVIELLIRIVVLLIFRSSRAVSHDKDKTVGSSLPHNDPQISVRSSTYDGTSTAPLLGKSNEIESAVASTPEDSGRAPPCFSPSEGQDAPLSTFARDQHSKPKLPLVSSFSINELSLAISESEKTRLCFSTIIAFLVVASCVKFPFLGQSVVRFLFGFRPLYLVLLTNATIVLGRLLSTKQKGFRVSDRRDSQVNPPEGQSSVEQIGKVLEASLVAQKAMGAILMDCSVFAVIVVSGLSLLQRL